MKERDVYTDFIDGLSYTGIEKTTGKHATLFVCDGDPFETRTQVKYVSIKGWADTLI